MRRRPFIPWLLVFCALAAGCAEPRTISAGRPVDLVVVSLDTVRRDHLSTFGYARPTSPNLDRLAGDSFVFWNAVSQETNTAPSHASMFTGLYPEQHGCALNGRRVADDVPLLAEILSGAGYATAAFVGGFSLDGRITALDRGFDLYDDDFEGKRRDGTETTRRAIRWLADRPDDRPLFLFLHLYDAHGPYLPAADRLALYRSESPGPTLERIPPYQRHERPDGSVSVSLNEYVDRYDAMIRTCDDRLGELLQEVDLERTIVVVLSDHGETLGERYRVLDHGGHVTDEQIRIPLVIHVPWLEPGPIEPSVETVDLLPTLLELLRVRAPSEAAFAGRDLLPLMRGEPIEDRSFTFSCAEAISERFADVGYRLDRRRHIFGVRAAGWKLIAFPGLAEDYWELYDLEADPGETRNVVGDHPEIREALLAALERHLAHAPADFGDEPALSQEEIEKLRSLGYLGD